MAYPVTASVISFNTSQAGPRLRKSTTSTLPVLSGWSEQNGLKKVDAFVIVSGKQLESRIKSSRDMLAPANAELRRPLHRVC
jgi:hypothetical protein